MRLPAPLLSLLALLLATSLASSTAVAQSRDFDRDRNNDALGFKIGETDLFPAVRLDYLQNSNAFLQPSDELAVNDVVISPELIWVADRRLVSLEGSYQGQYNVSSEEVLNFADHRLALDADVELSSRKRMSGFVSLDFGHEELGVNLTRGSANDNSDLVEFTDFQIEGTYRYGAANAKGNLSAGLLVQNFGHTSRNDVTSGRGFNRFEPFAEFSLRISGDTRLLSEIRFGSFRFEDSRRDRDDLSLLAGMQFAATGKTGGSLRVGAVQSQTKLASANDQTEFVLRALLFWEPASFSRFELDGRRELDNLGSSLVNTASGDGLSSVEDFVRLTWVHTWTGRVSHVAYVESRNFTRACPNLNDNTVTGSLEFNVQVRRWLSVGFGGSSTTRDIPGCPGTENSDPDLDYQQTRVGAHIRATL